MEDSLAITDRREKQASYSVVVKNENTAVICFDTFKVYVDNFLIEHRKIMEGLINEFLVNKLVVCKQMPKTASVAITENAEHKMIRGIVEEHVYMKNTLVSIQGEYQVYILPKMRPVESKIVDGRTEFKTGDLLGYRAFLLK